MRCRTRREEVRRRLSKLHGVAPFTFSPSQTPDTGFLTASFPAESSTSRFNRSSWSSSPSSSPAPTTPLVSTLAPLRSNDSSKHHRSRSASRDSFSSLPLPSFPPIAPANLYFTPAAGAPSACPPAYCDYAAPREPQPARSRSVPHLPGLSFTSIITPSSRNPPWQQGPSEEPLSPRDYNLRRASLSSQSINHLIEQPHEHDAYDDGEQGSGDESLEIRTRRSFAAPPPPPFKQVTRRSSSSALSRRTGMEPQMPRTRAMSGGGDADPTFPVRLFEVVAADAGG